MSISSLYGSMPMDNRTWRPHLVISEDKSPAEELVPDPYLPVIATDPLDSRRSIVIPRGRFLALGSQAGIGPDANDAYRFDYQGMPVTNNISNNYTYKTYLTLHNGKDTKPCGISQYQMFREWPEHPYNTPVGYLKHAFCSVPYIASVNDAYGRLKTGDRLTGYFGATTSTTPNILHVGKPVKWVEKKLYLQTNTASSQVKLLPNSAATLSGLPPLAGNIIGFASNSAGSAVTATSVVWDAAGASYAAVFPGNVVSVVYQYGQGADQIAGEVVRVESLKDISYHNSWLKWVEDNFGSWQYPPMTRRVPTTLKSNDTCTALDGTVKKRWRLSNYPVDFRQQITIKIGGTVTDDQNVTSSYSLEANPYTLPDAGSMFKDFSLGKYHSLNYLTGELVFTSNVNATGIQVTYNYETGYNQGVLFGAGQLGLTDGQNTKDNFTDNGQSTAPTATGNPFFGVPAHLDLADVVGELRFIVY